jgi:hypothetical protein
MALASDTQTRGHTDERNNEGNPHRGRGGEEKPRDTVCACVSPRCVPVRV